MIVLTAKRSAEPTPYAPDDAELAPIRPEAWAAWAKAAPLESPTESSTERPPDVAGPEPVRLTAGRSRWFRGAFIR